MESICLFPLCSLCKSFVWFHAQSVMVVFFEILEHGIWRQDSWLSVEALRGIRWTDLCCCTCRWAYNRSLIKQRVVTYNSTEGMDTSSQHFSPCTGFSALRQGRIESAATLPRVGKCAVRVLEKESAQLTETKLSFRESNGSRIKLQ